MAGKTIATIGGYTILASSPVRWSFSEGTDPVVETFDILNKDADALMNEGRKSVTLHLESDDRIIDIKHLWVLRRAPSDHKFYARITVADRRWLWPYAHVIGRYNVPLEAGVKRLASLDAPEITPTAIRFHYAPWSLKTQPVDVGYLGVPWTTEEVIKDVMGKARRSEKGFTGMPGMDISPRIGQELNKVPIEDLEINDAGNVAIGRVLAYLPEAGITVDKDGVIRIFSRVDGAELVICGLVQGGSSLEAEIPGRGHVEMISNIRTCPSKINVWFVRKQEVRFDTIEAESSASNTSPVVRDKRLMVNVLPVPDYKISMGAGNDVCQGTYVTVDAYLNALTAPPGTTIAKLDHRHLQRAFMPYLDLWGALQLLGIRDSDADWPARIAALMTHYRRTYRINPRWMSRFFKIFAHRVATLDVVTGTRAPSMAYADYAYVGSQRYWWKQLGETPGMGAADLAYAVNVNGYPQGSDMGDGVKKFDSKTKPAPIEVQILDHDLGIIHFNYRLDPVKLFDTVLPSHVENIPTGDLSNRMRPIAFNAVISGQEHEPPRLASSHKAAVIISAIPACPNDMRQFFRVEVPAADIAEMLPSQMRDVLNNAIGPEMDIFIKPGIEMARGVWLDDKATEIDQMFGVGGTNDARMGVDLIINWEEGNQNNPGDRAASLNEIAKAAAARVYAMYASHATGKASSRIKGSVTVAGWISRVTHEIAQNGEATTSIDLPEHLPALDWFAFMDASTRQILMRSLRGHV